MNKQLYFEDIEVGSEITPLSKIATTKMLVKWAGASGDFNPLHYEDKFAETQGVGSPIVHGELKRAWLVQMMMASPPRKKDARDENRQFIYVMPKVGDVLFWESWLRHEVPMNMAEDERISVSFNYKWVDR